MDEYFDTELAEIRLLKTGSNDSCHLTVSAKRMLLWGRTISCRSADLHSKELPQGLAADALSLDTKKREGGAAQHKFLHR